MAVAAGHLVPPLVRALGLAQRADDHVTRHLDALAPPPAARIALGEHVRADGGVRLGVLPRVARAAAEEAIHHRERARVDVMLVDPIGSVVDWRSGW